MQLRFFTGYVGTTIPGNSHSRAKRSLRFPTFRLPVSPTGRGRLQSQTLLGDFTPSSLRAYSSF